MKIIRYLLYSSVLFFPIYGFSQVEVSPFVSAGWMNHLTRNGVNSEAGIDFEFVKRIDVSLAYRYSLLAKNKSDEVTINAGSLFLSYVFVNKNKHRFMAGPGVSYGNYKRYSEGVGFEKEYKSWWLNFIKVRYDYKITKHFKVGADLSLYDDDGDGSTYLGILAGFIF